MLSRSKFKVGDRIQRKDIGFGARKIIREDDLNYYFDASYTKKVFGKEKQIKQEAMISKDDDRWEKVP